VTKSIIFILCLFFVLCSSSTAQVKFDTIYYNKLNSSQIIKSVHHLVSLKSSQKQQSIDTVIFWQNMYHISFRKRIEHKNYLKGYMLFEDSLCKAGIVKDYNSHQLHVFLNQVEQTQSDTIYKQVYKRDISYFYECDYINNRPMIGFSCGYGGSSTQNIEHVIKAGSEGKLDILIQMLYSVDPSTFSSAYMALNYFELTDQLSPLDFSRMKSLENYRIVVCNGCTSFESLMLNELPMMDVINSTIE